MKKILRNGLGNPNYRYRQVYRDIVEPCKSISIKIYRYRGYSDP